MPRKLTRNGYTRTGVWALIDFWIEKLLQVKRKKELAEARAQEEMAARERIRRENAATKKERSAAAFDRKILERRRR